MYAWEESFMSQVMKIRAKELHQLKNAAYLNASFAFTFTCAPFMVRFGYYRNNNNYYNNYDINNMITSICHSDENT